MYLKKHDNGVYYYRRPITGEDQAFWLRPDGTPKKEWGRSLATKDRRLAIDRMSDAADAYAMERAEHFERNGSRAVSPSQPSQRELEEREAASAHEEARKARFTARAEVRTLLRLRMKLSTEQLTPEEASARDLLNEKDQDHEELIQSVLMLEARVKELGGGRSTSPATAVNPAAPRTIEDLTSAYEIDKSPGWSGSSKKAVLPVFRFLKDIFPGRDLSSISREDARGAVNLLKMLPLYIGRRKEFHGLTIPQAIELGQKLGLPSIQPKTINDSYLLHIASMFNWAFKEQWITSTPFTGLAVHDPVDDAERRDPFAVNQLKKLFTSGAWATPWAPDRERAGDYWVPLLCLFHGFRNAEAAGLRVEDIGEDDGVPVIRIRAYNGRSIKNKDARGTVPIHPEMLRVGLLEYVESRRAVGEVLLFADGLPNKRGQVGAKLGERFSAHVRALGFVGRKLGMHSFRHNFEDRLREAELNERTALALARRSETGSGRTYGDGLSARTKAEAIAKIRYPDLDLSHLTGD